MITNKPIELRKVSEETKQLGPFEVRKRHHVVG